MERMTLNKMKICLFLIVSGMFFAPALQADYICPLEIFTANGDYNDSIDVILSVEFLDPGPGLLDVSFYNYSFVDCTIASVYFDDDANLLNNITNITGSTGVAFSQPATPGNLPAGNMLSPPFLTTVPFSADADSPPSQNGIDPNEWLQITFNLQNNVTFQNVIDELHTGNMRIGAHLISLPDGSSESAHNVTAPEPATITLLGLGGLMLSRRKRKHAVNWEKNRNVN